MPDLSFAVESVEPRHSATHALAMRPKTVKTCADIRSLALNCPCNRAAAGLFRHENFSLRQDEFDRLNSCKIRNGLPTWEEMMEHVFAAAAGERD
jgi:hypothetical protein